MTHTPPVPAGSDSDDDEYIITGFQLRQLQDFASLEFVCQAIRSRPHNPAPVPDIPVDVCNICDLAVQCDQRFGKNGYPSCVQRATKAAREQVLKELYLLAEDMISDGERMIQEEPMGKLYGKGKVITASVFQMRIGSLQSQQEPQQQNTSSREA